MKNMKYFAFGIAFSLFLFQSCDNTDDISSSMQLEKDADLKSGIAAKPGDNTKCATIQDGSIKDENGETIFPGFNDQGYNYQAHMYSGEMFPESYPGWYLEWNWNDAYLSNMDCDGDQFLDIANGGENYRGTGAWTTTKWSRTYTDGNGNTCRVWQFIKYVAVPEDATSDGQFFYDAEGAKIGQVVNSEGLEDFAMVQFVWNDPCQGKNGVDYKAPGPVGLGPR